MSKKRLFSLLVLAFAVFGMSFWAVAQSEGNNTNSSNSANAEAKPAGEESGKLDISKVIFGHISDAHEWHLFSIKHDNGGEPTPVAMPLPVIIYSPTLGFHFFSSSHIAEGGSYEGFHLEKMQMKEKIVADDGSKLYDLSITKAVLSMLISVVLLLWIALSASKKYAKFGASTAPKGMQNFLEVVIIFIRDEVGKPCIGSKYTKYMPLLLTVFFFIWINNLLGMLPGGANLTGNIAFTGCLALLSFIVILASSKKHYWAHMLNPPGVPLAIKPLLVVIEIVSLFIKPMALMIRLFANMLAGHIVIISLISIVFIFAAISKLIGTGFVPVSLAFAIFIFFIELLVAAIQAFIFTNLTAVFIGQAIEEPHDEHVHEAAHIGGEHH